MGVLVTYRQRQITCKHLNINSGFMGTLNTCDPGFYLSHTAHEIDKNQSKYVSDVPAACTSPAGRE